MPVTVRDHQHALRCPHIPSHDAHSPSIAERTVRFSPTGSARPDENQPARARLTAETRAFTTTQERSSPRRSATSTTPPPRRHHPARHRQYRRRPPRHHRLPATPAPHPASRMARRRRLHCRRRPPPRLQLPDGGHAVALSSPEHARAVRAIAAARHSGGAERARASMLAKDPDVRPTADTVMRRSCP